jgi:hypothetical protein
MNDTEQSNQHAFHWEAKKIQIVRLSQLDPVSQSYTSIVKVTAQVDHVVIFQTND